MYNQVHILAYFYHWSEKDILALSVKKRMSYIKLIQKQVKAESGKEDLEDELDD